MSPGSSVQRTIICKGAQLGFTAAAENVILFWSDEYPAEILYMSATDDLLKRWSTKRLEPAIRSVGLDKKIFAQHVGRKSRRSGDRANAKEFPGGALDLASAQSAASMRSDSKRVLIRDEIDGSPPDLRTGEGNWMKVSYVRTAAWGRRRKVLDFSTPTTYQESAIWPEYERGDQRRYFVPCPHCGAFQVLEWYRMKWAVVDGRIVDVHYECEACQRKILNYHKTAMLNAGQWRPTASATDDTVRSYHLSSLYSPIGMMSWEDIVKEYLDARDRPEGMRAFENLYLGLPYRETGERPKVESIVDLRGTYHEGTVPAGVLFLTMGIDVQRGSERDANNPPRLELEVCGHGLGYRTWSICYKRFAGEITHPEMGAWYELTKWAKESQLVFSRADGTKFKIMLTLIDSGDGMFADSVYQFCAGWGNTFPSKGFGILKKSRDIDGDQIDKNFDRYRIKRIKGDAILYEISTNYYKTIVYRNLKIPRKQPGEPNPSFSDFPIEYPTRYFEMLTSEERRQDGSYHAGGRRNESLDCRVLNLCAHDIWLDAAVEAERQQAKARGAAVQQLPLITKRVIMQKYAVVTGDKTPQPTLQ